jgi:hypothetical protein
LEHPDGFSPKQLKAPRRNSPTRDAYGLKAGAILQATDLWFKWLGLGVRSYPTPDGTCVREYVIDIVDAHLRALDCLLAKGERCASILPMRAAIRSKGYFHYRAGV